MGLVTTATTTTGALEGLDDELPRHPLVAATRAEFLHRLGHHEAAILQLQRAITLSTNETETRFLRDTLDAWTNGAG